ncbi:MAG TPA: 50S ribosomal protein L11 methyltransferase [Thermomicrobiales bacterium]|nr:50S ribosomal protein L11 methyltransferase [Thermomicrobiales bacterium]
MVTAEASATADQTTDPWLELTLVCDADEAEAVAELFASYDFDQGVVVEETAAPIDGARFVVAPERPVIVRTTLPTDSMESKRLRKLRDTLWIVRQKLWVWGQTRPIGPLEVRERQTADWTNAWQDDYSVHRVGYRVLVTAPWGDYAPLPGEIVLELDPGRGFGNGAHEATQLSMQALEEDLKAGDRVLDVGVGGGTLAIAAAKLGASQVDAVDIDPAAVEAARANAARNAVEKIVRVARGSVGPDEPFQGQYDIVVANITPPVVIPLAPWLTRATAPGGRLILGGVYYDEEAAVQATFSNEPLTLVRRRQLDEWVALVWRKPE